MSPQRVPTHMLGTAGLYGYLVFNSQHFICKMSTHESKKTQKNKNTESKHKTVSSAKEANFYFCDSKYHV